MKRNKPYFFLVFMFLVLIGVSWFSYQRNQAREAENIEVEFFQSPRFLDTTLVNKMLTQNWNVKSVQEKESLDLSMLEDQLKSIAEIENAEVYMLPQGELSVSITVEALAFGIVQQRLVAIAGLVLAAAVAALGLALSSTWWSGR